MQVSSISQPKPVPYLDIDQLCWLNASLACFLSPHQISKLSFLHTHLIKTMEDSKRLSQLSYEGLQELTIEQVQLIEDRETLQCLETKFYKTYCLSR